MSRERTPGVWSIEMESPGSSTNSHRFCKCHPCHISKKLYRSAIFHFYPQSVVNLSYFCGSWESAELLLFVSSTAASHISLLVVCAFVPSLLCSYYFYEELIKKTQLNFHCFLYWIHWILSFSCLFLLLLFLSIWHELLSPTLFLSTHVFTLLLHALLFSSLFWSHL